MIADDGAAAAGLSRSLAHRHVTMISIGGIIGAGLFVGSSVAIAGAGPAAVLSYLGSGVLIVLLMQMLGEMAVTCPSVRSFSEFTRAGLGAGAGFVAGWLYWYFWVVVIPVEAIAGAVLLRAWIALPTWILGLALMAAMTAVNSMSARSYGEFEFWFASIKVAAIIAFIALAAAYMVGGAPPGRLAFNLTHAGGFAPHGALAVLGGVATVFFAMTGAEITTVAAAESAEPARAIAGMTRSVIVRIVVFYVVSIFCIVAVVPWDHVVPGLSPFTLALFATGHPWVASSMSVVILTAVLSCLNSAFYVCSRVAIVDRGGWPVKADMERVDPVPATDLPGKDLAMALGEDGRRISRRNLLSRPGQFGLDREQAEDVLQGIGTTVAQYWRETLLTLGADPRHVDRLASWSDFAGELAGSGRSPRK